MNQKRNLRATTCTGLGLATNGGAYLEHNTTTAKPTPPPRSPITIHISTDHVGKGKAETTNGY